MDRVNDHLARAACIDESTPVSILLPAYNSEQYLEEAVRSVLRQTHRNFELIAINDGSTDCTGKILASLAKEDSRIRVITQENLGMGESLNRAAEIARYDWLVRMDADDVMHPNRLARQLAFLSERPDLVLSSTPVRYIDSYGKVIGQNRSDYAFAENVRNALRKNELVGFAHPAAIVRRDVFRTVGGYRSQFWPCDDLDLWGRILDVHPNGFLIQDEHLMFYRIHGDSVSVRSAKRVYQHMEWVRECMAERRAGRPEPTWEQFQQSLQSAPLTTRLNFLRIEAARTYYKAATLSYSGRRKIRALYSILLAGSLEPVYVIKRLTAQFRGIR